MKPSNFDAVSLTEYLKVIQPFLDDNDNTEIVINKPGEVITESAKGWIYHKVPDLDFTRCERIAKLTATFSKQSLDENKPIISATLPGGERVQVVIPPVTLEGRISFTIRRPSDVNFTLKDYEKQGFFDECNTETDGLNHEEKLLIKLKREHNYKEFLEVAIANRKNIILSGSAGSGKTTFYRSLLKLISNKERLLSIENVDELCLYKSHTNTTSLFYSAGGQGISPATQQELLQCTLRMKPDRIFLAELIRGDDAFYYLRNINSAHPGSITTMHANSAKMAFEQLVLFLKESKSGSTLSRSDIKQILAVTVDIIIQLKVVKGKRIVTEIYYEPEFKLQA